MPKFEQAKEDWLSHDDWQYADRDACWKFFYAAGQAELVALRAEITCEEKRFSDLWESYCAKCADNERLLEAALNVVRPFSSAEIGSPMQILQQALSTQPDTSALREHDAKLVERIAGEALKELSALGHELSPEEYRL